jgi:hypothetical protein
MEERMRKGVVLALAAGGLASGWGERCARAAEVADSPAGEPLPISGLLSLAVGRGLRFNNPYRLEKPLGDTAESVSLAATYLDIGGGVAVRRARLPAWRVARC